MRYFLDCTFRYDIKWILNEYFHILNKTLIEVILEIKFNKINNDKDKVFIEDFSV